MVTANRKTGKKGQPTPHNVNPMQGNLTVKENTYCLCGAPSHNKQLNSEENGIARKEGHELDCPACRQIADLSPAGIVVLNSDFYTIHKTDILNYINKAALDASTKNRSGWTVDIHIHKGKDCVTITTPDEKLAQQIRREVFRLNSGNDTTSVVIPEAPSA